MKLLDGMVAVITGASSGNGRAIAKAFASEGAKAIICCDIQQEPREGGVPTDKLVTDIGSAGHFLSVDVANLKQIKTAIDAAEEFGGVNILVNNAGILSTVPLLEVSEEEFNRSVAINIKGVFFASQMAAHSMILGKRQGSIINLSSVSGLRGTSELPVYSTTKGAVQLMTFALAAALGPHNIRVNAINPGIINTRMTHQDMHMMSSDALKSIPLHRFGEPVDVANTAVYLASRLAAYVTGASLLVDGGMTNTGAVYSFAKQKL